MDDLPEQLCLGESYFASLKCSHSKRFFQRKDVCKVFFAHTFNFSKLSFKILL